MIIRPEQPQDIPSIRQLNELAFGQPTEARLVDLLREARPEALSTAQGSGPCSGLKGRDVTAQGKARRRPG